MTGVAEGVAGQHVTHGFFRFLQRHRDDHAFTGRQAIGFDDDRCAFAAHIGQRRLYLGEVFIFGGRDAVARQKSLVKALEPSSCAAACDGPKIFRPAA